MAGFVGYTVWGGVELLGIRAAIKVRHIVMVSAGIDGLPDKQTGFWITYYRYLSGYLLRYCLRW